VFFDHVMSLNKVFLAKLASDQCFLKIVLIESQTLDTVAGVCNNTCVDANERNIRLFMYLDN
jgi:hypothetical protein